VFQPQFRNSNPGYKKCQSDTLKNHKQSWNTRMNRLTYPRQKFIRTHWNKFQGIKSTITEQKGFKLTYPKVTNRSETATHLSNNSPSIFRFLKINNHLYFSHSRTIPYWLFWLHCLFLSWAMTHITTIPIALIHGYALHINLRRFTRACTSQI